MGEGGAGESECLFGLGVDGLKHLAVGVTVEPRLLLSLLEGSLARGHLFQGLGQLL